MRTRMRTVARTTVAAVAIFIVQWGFVRELRPDGPTWAVAGFAALLLAVSLVEELAAAETLLRMLRVLRAILSLVGAVALLVNILAVPQSAYVTWFRLALEGNARGAVSFVFILVDGYFCAILGAAMVRHGVARPLFGILFTITAIAAVIVETPAMYWLTVTTGFLTVAVVVSSRFRGDGSGRHRVRAIFAVLVFLGVAVGFGAIGQKTIQPRGNRLVDVSLSPGIRDALLKMFPHFPILFAIPGYGYSFETRALGSTPVLSERNIFRVTAPEGETVYVRTAAYDTYDGGQWSVEPDALHYSVANGKTAVAGIYDSGLRRRSPGDIEITLLSDFYSFLPIVPDLAGFNMITPRYRGAPTVEYGNLATGFFLTNPMVQGDSIILRPRAPGSSFAVPVGEPAAPAAGGAAAPRGAQLPKGAAVVLPAAEAAVAGVDSGDATAELARYLQVPESLPEEVRGMAETFGAPLNVPVPVSEPAPAGANTQPGAAETDTRTGAAPGAQAGAAATAKSAATGAAEAPASASGSGATGGRNVEAPIVASDEPPASAREVLTRAAAIRYAVQSGSKYSLATKAPPQGADLVDYFLFKNRTGYCVHFATSFVVLARLSGIPARYATGFLVNMPEDANVREVSGLTSHAWPEIYVPGSGWRIFEVTPPVQAGYSPDFEGADVVPPSRDELTSRQLRALLGTRTPAEPAEEAQAGPTVSAAVVALSGAILLGLLALILAGTYVARNAVPLGPPPVQFRRLARGLIRITTKRGVRSPGETGWAGWMKGTSIMLSGPNAPRLRRALELLVTRIYECFFGGREILRRDVRFAHRMLLRLRRSTYR